MEVDYLQVCILLNLNFTFNNYNHLGGNDTPKKSKILKGFNVSFGKVDNPEDLRALIKSHSGNVLEYVSKTVCIYNLKEYY